MILTLSTFGFHQVVLNPTIYCVRYLPSHASLLESNKHFFWLGFYRLEMKTSMQESKSMPSSVKTMLNFNWSQSGKLCCMTIWYNLYLLKGLGYLTHGPTIEGQPPYVIVVMCYKNTTKAVVVSSVYVMISNEIV